MAAPLVVKLGGELLETPARLAAVVDALARLRRMGSGGSRSPQPLVVVHGGGREIGAALEAAGLETRQVDGLRITDDATLDVVVSVLGAVNTRLVAALAGAAVPAVGLTGADAASGLSDPAPPHEAVDGRRVDLGRVGVPSGRADVRLLTTLVDAGFVPVVACIGIYADGRLCNVNADTLAGHLAARLGARRLVVAGATPGVLDAQGRTIAQLDPADVARLIADRTATAGMVAKLQAGAHALRGGVADVVIVDGRDPAALEAAAREGAAAAATRLVQTVSQAS
jgi:acetylglutamate kinase